MGRKFKDFTGMRIGIMDVIQRTGESRGRAPLWLIRCDCGNETSIPSSQLANPKAQSCGCLKKAMLLRGERLRHGHSRKGQPRTRTYSAWLAMRERCNNPKNNRYSAYGGRGIFVSPDWNASFDAFLADMGEAPSSEYTIDRIDVDGPYNKDNCRWLVRSLQSRNTRQVKVDDDGVRFIRASDMSAFELAKKFNVLPATIYSVRSGKTAKHVK